jgi:Fur family transcriptional regulator, ferric uptake regulator
MARQHAQQAEDRIRATGARVTRPRIEVMAALLGAGRALTHHEVERRLSRGLAIDRVTIYRVLDWLTGNGLAHKIAGDDRVWRYNVAGHEHAREHAHFKCNRCGTVICLDDVDRKPTVRLPAGFRSQEIELLVKGLCAGCVPSRVSGAAPPHRH